ncbi:MAG: DUF2339 domain-containing protein [Vicinamibacterales bacterium]
MFEIGLLVVGVIFVITFMLPVVSFVRVLKANRLAESTRLRLDQLEAEVRRLSLELRQTGQASQTGPRATAPALESLPTVLEPPVPEAAAESFPAPSAPLSVPPAPAVAPAPVAPAPAVASASTGEGLEQLIGGRWLLYLGLAGLVLGMSYFVKFAFDNGWVSEELRVAAAVLTGVCLIVAGLRFSARGLGLFGQALAGAGIVVLYVSIYAALHFYRLLTPGPAFALMALVTAGASFLAHREASPSLAILAVVGGFATPLLIGGDRQVQVVLFTYVGILVLGTMLLVRVHAWPAMSLVAYGCTFVLVLLWLLTSYEPSAWLRTELFLTAYLVMFLHLLWGTRQAGTPSEPARFAQAALLTAPLAFHAASLYLLTDHDAALLSYFLLFTVGGLAAAAAARRAWIRVATLLLVGIPLMIWMTALTSVRWYAPALFTLCVIYSLHLASQWHALSGATVEDRSPGEAVHAQLNGLLLPLTLYAFLDPRFQWWNPRMAALLSILNGSIAWAMRNRLPALRRQYLALAATLAAVAIALAFDGPVVALGWAIEGAVLGWIALSGRSRLFAVASGVMICCGAIQLAIVLQDPLTVRSLPLFNVRAAVVILVIAVLSWLASRMRHDSLPTVSGQLRNAVIILANLLAIGLLSADIQAYFSQRALDARAGDVRTSARDAGLMQQVALSVTWAAYAVGLIAAGIRRRYAPARYLAMLLLAVTVMKVMTRDIAELDRLYRMLSVLAVGVLLVLASYLYQRMGREQS